MSHTDPKEVSLFTVTTANVIFGIPRRVKHSNIINIVANRIKKILLSPSSDRRCLSVDEIVNIAKDPQDLYLDRRGER